MRRNERGFTFIEVLVVMGIIAVLAGLTVGAMAILNRRKPQMMTQARVSKVAAVVDQWFGQFERYPPSDPTKLKRIAGGASGLPVMDNSTNLGIETLYQALYWPTFPGDPGLNDDELGNTDDDQFEKPSHQGTEIYEIVDAWGNPLIIFIHTDYANADEDPPSYITSEEYGELEVTPRPWRYVDEARGFAEPNKYQIYSMGEDGEPNTEDDIKSWE